MKSIAYSLLSLLGSVSFSDSKKKKRTIPTRTGKTNKKYLWQRPNCSPESAKLVYHNGTAFVYPQTAKLRKEISRRKTL